MKRTFQSGTAQGLPLVAAGTLLVAATYGMARFGVGLLHPAMAVDRPGIATALPSAGAAQFASYCVAAAAAGLVVPRRSRAVAGAAGVVAGIGCLGLATSTAAGWFVVSAFVSGAGAGLASPALVGLLDAVVPERVAGAAQAVVNSGTSLGVVVTGLLATVVTTPAPAWAVMAAACVAAAAAVVALTSGAVVADASDGAAAAPHAPWPCHSRWPSVPASPRRPCGPSAPPWSSTAEHSDPDQVGLLWAVLGLGGLAGAFVARPVSRHGPTTAFLVCTAALLVGSVAVLAPGGGPARPLLGAACFGAAYMSLSSVLILWGRVVDPRHGATATAWLFIALAVGQAVGAQLLGTLLA